MEDPHISHLVTVLTDRFKHFGENVFDLDAELLELKHPVTKLALEVEVVKDIERQFLENVGYRKAHDGAILIPVSVVGSRDHEEWYEEWLQSNASVGGGTTGKDWINFYLSN
ncbi:hypothetical protein [Chitinophaga caseinilytica]|uniref:Uncharacterized protein n=1 Tax=Chitinophaga caseinilytica TaxID=2267521 RepID=A0ABZ2Z7Y9_9BACT